MKEIIVALIGAIVSLVTLFVTTNTNKKIKKQDEVRDEFRKEMREHEKRTNKKLDVLDAKIDNVDRKNDLNRKKELRSKLVREYTALIHGASRSPQEMQDIEDDWHEYRVELNGDSYVEDLHDIYVEMKKREIGGK